jgi:hypothetical protein
MQNAKCKMQNAKCKMQNAKCKMQNAKCKMQNAKCKMIVPPAGRLTVDGGQGRNSCVALSAAKGLSIS